MCSVAILGFHGMLNQVQYHQAFIEKGEQKGSKGGFQGMSPLLLLFFLATEK